MVVSSTRNPSPGAGACAARPIAATAARLITYRIPRIMRLESIIPHAVTLDSVLSTYWGYSSFRPLQREAMDAILAGRDSVVVLPTGGGKSLCFQAPALVKRRHGSGPGLVVSPLISLMKDQVDTLVESGVDAAFYNSALSADQKATVWAGIREGRYALIYVSPERLAGEGGDVFLQRLGSLAYIAVDEGHCISQ